MLICIALRVLNIFEILRFYISVGLYYMSLCRYVALVVAQSVSDMDMTLTIRPSVYNVGTVNILT